MELKEIYTKLQDKLQNLCREDSLKNILFMGNKLYGFDAINRIMIYLQNKNSFELCTEQEWSLKGRKVLNRCNGINVVVPQYSFTYTYENGEVADINDMNTSEITKALQHKIIYKKKEIIKVFCNTVYDISNTQNNNKNNDSIIKDNKLSYSDLLDLFKKITGFEIEKNDENYYSSTQKILFIAESEYQEFSDTISKYLAKFLMQTNNIYDKEEYINCIGYSISTLLSGNSNIGINISINDTKELLYVVDTCINFVWIVAKYANIKDVNINRVDELYKLNKADNILDIMESNIIYNRLKGILP